MKTTEMDVYQQLLTIAETGRLAEQLAAALKPVLQEKKPQE